MIDRLRSLPSKTWLRLVPFAAVAALAIGVPTDLIDTPFFAPPIRPGLVDYAIWVTTALLIGLIFSIQAPEIGESRADDTKPLWGGFVSVLAVGCPVCNQAVVALVGTSGALSWWAPVQPIVGLVAIGILLVALRKRLHTYDLEACPLPESDPLVAGDRVG